MRGGRAINTDLSQTIEARILEVSLSLHEVWGEDSRTKDLNDRIKNFISQVEDSDLREIILELIYNFKYFSKSKINELLVEFHIKIKDELELNEDLTIYSRIEDENQAKIDSSNTILEEFKICNEISNNFTYEFSKLTEDQLNYVDNIVVFDDIIGSGKTLISFLRPNLSKIRSSRIKLYVFCFVILEEALERIQEFINNNGIDVEIKYNSMFPKAFKRNYIFKEDFSIYEEKIREHENSKRMSFVLGYENSQALVAFYRNTPNNTLPTFWWNSTKWKGLFPRDNRKPTFMLKGKDNKKNKVAYNLTKMESRE